MKAKALPLPRLLEWMASDEGYYLLGFGVKDVNYKLDENGFITTEGLEDANKWTSKEAQPLTQLANMVYIFSDVEMQARYVAYKTKNGRDMDPKAYYAAFLKQPLYPGYRAEHHQPACQCRRLHPLLQRKHCPVRPRPEAAG